MEIIPPYHKTADSLELVEGSSGDSVTDIQTLDDGNEYHIDETNTTPGTDIRLTFNHVVRFSQVVYNSYYKSNSSTHVVEMKIYNYSTVAWDTYTTIQPGLGYNYRYFDVRDFSVYVSSRTTLVRFVHELTGNASHDFYIDYIALVR